MGVGGDAGKRPRHTRRLGGYGQEAPGLYIAAMKWALIAGGGLIVLLVGVVGIGIVLPESHITARTRRYPISAERLWQVIYDVAAYPTWRSDVARVDVGSDGTRWTEIGKNGTIPYERVESAEPLSMTVRITDPNLPFGGRWEYRIAPVDGGAASELTITERGEVHNPLFRFMSKFVFGHASTIEHYLDDLERRVGEAVNY